MGGYRIQLVAIAIVSFMLLLPNTQGWGEEGHFTVYNLTESLLFLSHFIGDIHQPLHCGFLSDKGGNTINVQWFTTKQNLHRVWDDSIIEIELERFYDSNLGEFIDAIQNNITKVWGDQVEEWENCSSDDIACPITYAYESSQDCCKWAYKDGAEGSTLEGPKATQVISIGLGRTMERKRNSEHLKKTAPEAKLLLKR
ncbi:S1/P1 nuclease family protein [Medicago truncatula]|uniref:Aspergillus nuclease S1 n=1 Tax=Medicago truncatula TaxID=3880 RepID=G7K1K3_MEDTR|nr:S1/P1 nuclease family protein [Medicago truncatula]